MKKQYEDSENGKKIRREYREKKKEQKQKIKEENENIILNV